SQTDVSARRQLDPMDGQPQSLGKIPKQAEGVTGLDNEQPRPVDGHYLIEDVVQRGGLAGTGRPEQKQVGIHLPVLPVEWVEGDGAAAAIEEGDAGVA